MKSYLFSSTIFFLLSLITPATFTLSSAIPVTNSKAIHQKTRSATSIHPKPALKKFSLVKRYLYKFKAKARKANTGAIILLILGAILVTFLFAFIIFALAYGGASSSILFIISALGFGLIIFGIVRILKSIKRKSGTALLRHHLRRSVTDNTAAIKVEG
jgi:hypothetical protein